MVGGPLTGACYNPARWFGAALVSNHWGGVCPYLVGPLVGALLAVAVFRFVLEAGGKAPSEPPQQGQTRRRAQLVEIACRRGRPAVVESVNLRGRLFEPPRLRLTPFAALRTRRVR